MNWLFQLFGKISSPAMYVLLPAHFLFPRKHATRCHDAACSSLACTNPVQSIVFASVLKHGLDFFNCLQLGRWETKASDALEAQDTLRKLTALRSSLRHKTTLVSPLHVLSAPAPLILNQKKRKKKKKRDPCKPQEN